MSNYAASQHDLDRYLTARVPVIGLRTIEQQRALRMVKEVAGQPRRSGQQFWIHTRATGLRDLRTTSSVLDDRSFTGATDFAAAQFAVRQQATLVLVDPGDVESDSPLTRELAELARIADDNAGCVVLLTDSPIWSGLQRLGMSLQLDLPDADEMHGIIGDFLDAHHGVVPVHWSGDDVRRAAEFLRGVTEGEAVNLMATLVAKGSVEADDVLELARSKDRIFNDLAGLERLTLKSEDYAVGGLSSLRDWLERKHRLMHTDLRGTGLRPPRGVLLVGVPGCGKSLSAKAIAQQWQLPLYRLDMASIHGRYLGESESRMREALQTADRVAPCILWIDEIEKGLAGSHDISGVSQRVIGQFLFWLQESDSRAFVVATANDVRSLPPELLRKGRFDELFFVDLPDETDRREIIELYYRRYVKTEPEPGQIDRLVDLSEGFAGSDIESALHDVGAEVLLGGGADRLSPSFIEDIFANTAPLIRSNPEQIEEIRAWGRERAVPAGRPAHGTGPVGSPNGHGRRVVLLGDD
ncbi:AAA family ATPase [Streptomyces sp. MAI_2237]